MDFMDNIIIPLLDEFTNGWLSIHEARPNTDMQLFIRSETRFHKVQGMMVCPMTVEAGMNQPGNDCDYARDETAFLKAGFYTESCDFDELDPVFIPVSPIGIKHISQTQEGS